MNSIYLVRMPDHEDDHDYMISAADPQEAAGIYTAYLTDDWLEHGELEELAIRPISPTEAASGVVPWDSMPEVRMPPTPLNALAPQKTTRGNLKRQLFDMIYDGDETLARGVVANSLKEARTRYVGYLMMAGLVSLDRLHDGMKADTWLELVDCPERCDLDDHVAAELRLFDDEFSPLLSETGVGRSPFRDDPDADITPFADPAVMSDPAPQGY